MKRLIDLIKSNSHLKYIDAESGDILHIRDFNGDTGLNELKKQLAFLYLDNSLLSVKVILSFFESPHAFVLLNPKLNEGFKTELETLYTPDFIFDATRSEIKNYETITFIVNEAIFQRNKKIGKCLPTKLRLLLTTSGTTGSPKFVKLSEANIVANAQSIVNYLPINKEEIAPLNLSIFYSYGLSVFTSNSIAGGTVICTNKDIINKEFWMDFEKYGYTTLAGVPYVYEILNRIGFLKKDYPSLRYMTQAGGKLNTKLIEIFHNYLKEREKLFYVMYGQTEATARMSYLPPQYLDTKIGSIGVAIPNGSFQIDEETNELIYNGPNVFGGYATCLEDLADFEENQILKTGDLARKDEDDYYYIMGRSKRFIKIFGTRTNLDEIENILKNEFIGNSFYAIGSNDEKLVIFSNNLSLNETDVKSFLKEKMQIHPSVIKTKILENIPLTSNGKVNYSALLDYVS